MAGKDVGPPGAADAGVQTPVMCSKSLHLHARMALSTSADPSCQGCQTHTCMSRQKSRRVPEEYWHIAPGLPRKCDIKVLCLMRPGKLACHCRQGRYHVEAGAQVKHAQSGSGCCGLVVAKRWQASLVAGQTETCSRQRCKSAYQYPNLTLHRATGDSARARVARIRHKA